MKTWLYVIIGVVAMPTFALLAAPEASWCGGTPAGCRDNAETKIFMSVLILIPFSLTLGALTLMALASYEPADSESLIRKKIAGSICVIIGGFLSWLFIRLAISSVGEIMSGLPRYSIDGASPALSTMEIAQEMIAFIPLPLLWSIVLLWRGCSLIRQAKTV